MGPPLPCTPAPLVPAPRQLVRVSRPATVCAEAQQLLASRLSCVWMPDASAFFVGCMPDMCRSFCTPGPALFWRAHDGLKPEADFLDRFAQHALVCVRVSTRIGGPEWCAPGRCSMIAPTMDATERLLFAGAPLILPHTPPIAGLHRRVRSREGGCGPYEVSLPPP